MRRTAKWLHVALTAMLLLSVFAPTARADGDFTGSVVYQIITDRFYDGNTSNNNPSSSPNLYDATKTNWWFYWGGDWAGIQAKLPYLSNMGVGAIWLSPGAMNVNQAIPVTVNGSVTQQAGYHGYWTMDFYKPEPHFGTFTDFDSLVSAAHSYGIKVILDWVPNHSNQYDVGLFGALYNNGTLVTTYNNDSNGYYHHNGSISDYNSAHQTQYQSIVDLADFANENTAPDTYLRGAVDTWLTHNVDGLRVDAVKLMTHGWQKAYADHILANKNIFLFGEWFDNSGGALWNNMVKFANTSGIQVLNFDMNNTLRNVFMSGGSMTTLDATISYDASMFTYPNQLPVFIDNQDMARFLSVNNNQGLFHDALVASMTVPGIPVVYYGDEQYLHNDTNGGNDPYNRPMMTNWDQTTTAYKLVQKLSAVRSANAALRYGTSGQRWLNDNVYIFERKFYNDVVLVAINKGTTSQSITGLYTAMPAGTYSDQLGGLLGGSSITVTSGSSGNNPVNAFTLGAGQAAVWSYVTPATSTPKVGSVNPVMGRANNEITIVGKDFGTTTGTVNFTGASGTVVSWSANKIIVKVPTGATPGNNMVSVTTSEGTSNSIAFNVLSGVQVPVTMTVNNAYPTNYGDNIYVTGNVPELGSWSTSSTTAIGPMLAPNYPTWFYMASVPASTAVQFKAIDIQAGGGVIWENGSNHTWTTPSSGVGSVTWSWQY